ncbi:MAG: hypothetical protein HY260_03655, partial [Chloroflexi bacterium]|nr:hypothetical protein [Chloroflexota bacterium]
MISRADIFARYSWLAPGDEPETVIIGDDLDSALSAVLFLRFHPNARLVGLYRGYEKVVFSPSQSWTQVCNSVWLDLDIYHPDCRSLGHHILRL